MGNHGAEVLLDDFGVLAQPAVHIEEQDALFLQIFTDGVVDRFRFVLCRDPAQPFLLGLRDAQPVKRVLDVVRHIIPVAFCGVRGTEEVRDIVKINVVEFATVAPVRHFPFHEVMVGFNSNFGHPLWFVFQFGDVSYDLFAQPFVKANGGILWIVKTKPVLADHLSCFVAHAFTSEASSQSYPCSSSLRARSGPPDITSWPSIMT